MNNNLAYAYAINNNTLKAHEKAELFKQEYIKKVIVTIYGKLRNG